MIKINCHKKFSDFSPFRQYPRKITFFTNKLYISDVYHIFPNRRDVKGYENQCFDWSLVWYRYVPIVVVVVVVASITQTV